MLAAALFAATAMLAGCSFQNRYEREADKITRAVIADDMRPVIGDFAPSIRGEITRVRVAELSDEFAAQGKYEGLKEDDRNCRPGYHCFDVRFAKAPYREILQMNDQGKVTAWFAHMGAPGTPLGT